MNTTTTARPTETNHPTIDGVRAITAALAVVVLAASTTAAAWTVATHDPGTLELAPASAATVRNEVTTSLWERDLEQPPSSMTHLSRQARTA